MGVLYSIKPVSAEDKQKILAIASEMSSKFSVPYNIVVGVIDQESRFDPLSYRWNEENSADRSFGLMHLTIPTAQSVANALFGAGKVTIDKDYLYNARNNVMLGVKYLRQQFEKYGTWEKAISAYNAGRPITSNIISYVQNVLRKGANVPNAGKMALASLVVGSLLVWAIYNKVKGKR